LMVFSLLLTGLLRCVSQRKQGWVALASNVAMHDHKKEINF